MIEVRGLTETLAGLAKRDRDVLEATKLGLVHAAAVVQQAWIDNIIGDDLVLTGHYRDSIKVYPDGLQTIVRTDDTPYAGYLEFGTSRQAAHYPATRAADEHHDEVVSATGEEVRKAL